MNRTDEINAQIAAHRDSILLMNSQIARLENELREIEAAAEAKAAKPTTHKIQWLDANGLTKNSDATMEVHGAGCQHLKRYGRSMWADISPVEEWTSPEEFARDYNGDFYNEGTDHWDGLAGCHAIAFYPCTGMVSKRKVIRGFEHEG